MSSKADVGVGKREWNVFRAHCSIKKSCLRHYVRPGTGRVSEDRQTPRTAPKMSLKVYSFRVRVIIDFDVVSLV